MFLKNKFILKDYEYDKQVEEFISKTCLKVMLETPNFEESFLISYGPDLYNCK